MTTCDGAEDRVECPTVITPVIIPAVQVTLFDKEKNLLNVCDAILTVENNEISETVYGSSRENCEAYSSLRAGYNLVKHNVLIEKAGYISQSFKGVLPIETHCGYDPHVLEVYLSKE